MALANHYDSHFLPFLVDLAQAMRIDVKLITADEAYHDKDGSFYRETGTIVTAPPSAKVTLPENVNGDTGATFCPCCLTDNNNRTILLLYRVAPDTSVLFVHVGGNNLHFNFALLSKERKHLRKFV